MGTPYDWADIWLADAHDPVLHAMDFVIVHILLLMRQLPDDRQTFCLFGAQTHVILCQKQINITQVAVHILELFPDCLSNLFGGALFAFGKTQVILPGIPAIHTGFVIVESAARS